MTIADADRAIRHVFLHGIVLQVSIGVHPHEHGRTQRVRINLDLGVAEAPDLVADRLDNVVDYEVLAGRVRAIAAASHVKLVETLAERIVQDCLLDTRVRVARVRVEKLDVFADICAAGVEIERRSPAHHPPPDQTT